MTQTQNGMSFRAAKAFVSPDGSTWTDMGGHGATVQTSGGDRVVGEQQTMDGDTPILKAGKRGKIDITSRYVYTEEAAEPFEIIRAAYETEGGALYFQFSPKDGFWYSTGAGIVVRPGYPGGDVASGDVIMSEFMMSCSALTKAAAST
jgi:hypothetical protein